MQEILARKLRVLRAERGITLQEAEELTGVTRETLGALEHGQRGAYTNTLQKIAKGYGVTVGELLEAEDLKAVPLADASETGPTEVGEAADLRRLRQALWLQLRELDVAGAVRTEAPRSRLGEVLEVLEELDNVEKRMVELAPTPLATITERTNGEALIIYHDGATLEVRARLRREYPGAEEIEAQEPVFAYS
jgi:transcriptional regulator with XRE-family HTH domain